MTWVRRFFADLLGAYTDGVRFARGLPLLFAVMVLWEFGQHVLEVRIGFFDSIETSRAVSLDGSRMILGWIKMILVYAIGFFAIRFFVLADRERTLRVPASIFRAYLPYVLYSLAMFSLIMYAPFIVGAQSATTFRMVVSLVQLAVEPLLMLWIVSAATDGPVRNPIRSVICMGRFFFWAFALFFAGRIPINAAHGLLNRYAVGQPPALLWTMLVGDAVVVGLLAGVIPAIYVRVAGLIGERRKRSAATHDMDRDEPKQLSLTR